MVGGARWILIGAALMLVASAFALSCGGGGSGNCLVPTSAGTINVCGSYLPIGASLEKISLCPGTPPPPTPVPTSTASPLPTPMETVCAAPLPTTVVPMGGTAVFHAVGTYSDSSTQDITNSATTVWTSSDPATVMANNGAPGTSTGPGTFFAAGIGTAEINANSPGVAGPGAQVEVVPSPTPTPAPTPTPSG